MNTNSTHSARPKCLLHTRLWFSAIAIFGLMVLASCSGIPNPMAEPVRVGDVVAMSKQGVPPAQIIDRIEESGTVYRLDENQLAQLRQQGVSNQVINYMQSTHAEAIERDETLDTDAAWILEDDGYRYGGCFYSDWPAAYC